MYEMRRSKEYCFFFSKKHQKHPRMTYVCNNDANKKTKLWQTTVIVHGMNKRKNRIHFFLYPHTRNEFNGNCGPLYGPFSILMHANDVQQQAIVFNIICSSSKKEI